MHPTGPRSCTPGARIEATSHQPPPGAGSLTSTRRLEIPRTLPLRRPHSSFFGASSAGELPSASHFLLAVLEHIFPVQADEKFSLAGFDDELRLAGHSRVEEPHDEVMRGAGGNHER